MSLHIFKTIALAVALSAALVQPSMASTYTFDTLHFDGISAGAAANSDPTALTHGISFDNAYYGAPVDANGDPVLDGNGDPITTEAWRIDPTVSDPVTVEDTGVQAWESAPSSPNALDARQSPILLHFTGPVTLAGFSFTLPDSSFGTLGGSVVDFLDAAGQILGSLSFNEGNPLSTVSLSGGPILGIKDVALASGTFYDNINISVVPAPATLSLILAGLPGLLGFYSRRKTA